MTATIEERLARHRATAYAIAHERTDPDDVDDMAQEAMIEMWKQLRRAEERESAGDSPAVLNKAARLRVMRVRSNDVALTGQPRRQRGQKDDRARDASLDAMRDGEDGWDRFPAPVKVEDEVLESMDWERIKNRVHALPAEQRDAVLLRLQGEEYPEIGRHLGISRQAAMGRVDRARKHLLDLVA